MSTLKKQKIQFHAETKLPSVPDECDLFSECSFGTALDNVYEQVDELKDELALLQSEFEIFKNLLDVHNILPSRPPALTRQVGGFAPSSDQMATDIDCLVNCCNDNTKP